MEVCSLSRKQISSDLVAYSSISHLGFVLLGVFAWNAIALEGAVMQMLAHGVTTGALFILAGGAAGTSPYSRHAPDGWLMGYLPRFGAIGLFFAIASLGCPAWEISVGEFLVLLGTYRVNIP